MSLFLLKIQCLFKEYSDILDRGGNIDDIWYKKQKKEIEELKKSQQELLKEIDELKKRDEHMKQEMKETDQEIREMCKLIKEELSKNSHHSR